MFKLNQHFFFLLGKFYLVKLTHREIIIFFHNCGYRPSAVCFDFFIEQNGNINNTKAY